MLSSLRITLGGGCQPLRSLWRL